MADSTFTHVCSLRLLSLFLRLPPCEESKATRTYMRAHKLLYAPLDYFNTDTPAAFTEALYVKASGLFVAGAEGCVSGLEEGGRGDWRQWGCGGG